MQTKIVLNSDEFKAWHEVGHATVCLHLGGDVDAIEFLERDARGYAVARGCYVTPDTERSVACGGFAAEYYLLQAGLVNVGEITDPNVNAAVSAHLFSNAWADRQAFSGRTVTQEDDFTAQEDEEFMIYSIEHVVPIVDKYFVRMKDVVIQLLANRKIGGHQVREILKIGSFHLMAIRPPNYRFNTNRLRRPR
jgi:hypothetical protein